MGEPRIRSRCACGWEAIGTEDEVVAATIEHGRRIHNMTGTREDVLARAERLEVAPGAGAARTDAGAADPVRPDAASGA